MNRTIRNLVIAAPLVLVGITAAPAAAMADGFDIVLPPNDGDPEQPPQDKAPLPQPKPPQDKAPLPQPKPPQDKAPLPQAQPNGGTDASAPVVKDAKTKKEAKKVVSAKGSPDSIDRNENLFVAGPAEVELVADNNNGGMDLTWLLVGGGVVTASGIAFAARKRANA